MILNWNPDFTRNLSRSYSPHLKPGGPASEERKHLWAFPELTASPQDPSSITAYDILISDAYL
jgi:hypothetical protein